jgi:cellobiose phosphorylase
MTKTENSSPIGSRTLQSAAGLSAELLAHGAIGRFEGLGLSLNLFPGNEMDGAPAQLWLRRHHAEGIEATPLTGPQSPLQLQPGEAYLASGEWQGLRLQLSLRLAEAAAAWFWHLQIENLSAEPHKLDLIHAQDIALAPYGGLRVNEYYVSQYLDLCPLQHAQQGWVLAARQNLAVAGRHPWALLGSLRRGQAYATDALQVQGLGLRAGLPAQALSEGLPASRLQHEHAMLAVQDEALLLAPGGQAALGFFGRLLDDHAPASGEADLRWVDETLALPEAQPLPTLLLLPLLPRRPASSQPVASLFASAALLSTLDLDTAELNTLFGGPRRHEERDADGELLSFFAGEARHVVLRAKELRMQRPHGHLLRSGVQLVPDERALTSTVWMGGVFHSMLTQGHVSINRCLSTVRSWLSLFRSQGQRVFIDAGQGWQQLGLPSAFEIESESCRWIYKHAGGLIELRSQAQSAPHAMTLSLRVLQGAPVRVLVSHHVALGGDDGSAGPQPLLALDEAGLFVGAPEGSELAQRFPGGGFRIEPEAGTRFAQWGDDALLFADGRSRGQPFVCVVSEALRDFGLRLRVQLVPGLDQTETPPSELNRPLTLPSWHAPAEGAQAAACAQLRDILPWYRHNALIHYLSPRGLEQFSGGGWGTRDVCQGPLEMLLALGHTEPVRDLLLRVFSAQNVDGDWPQWFMFFEREREIRAGDSHGDIVFWPLLALARYLLASEDAAVLDEPLPFFTPAGQPAQSVSLWSHVERSLALIRRRCVAGTHLAAYWHGDWNDSLQPADPALREQMCSAWTVTLHHQMLGTLSRALARLGRAGEAAELDAEAARVRVDFQRLLLVDGVIAGYAIFDADSPKSTTATAPQLLLHPSDRLTGVHYSLLPMMHAILDDMLSPAQAAQHLALIETHLKGPDGARLFDAPLPYRGGPEQLFQRAESSSFFGREIGVMYMHAHLRYAEMLAHLGEAERFFAALAQAHPVLLRQRVPSASLRQANCYFSSSDAAFADRYQAQQHYADIAQGSVALDGGWRVYSSGPGIAIGLVVGSFLGWRIEKSTLIIDPVMPSALNGLHAELRMGELPVDVEYRVGAQGCGPLSLQLNGRALAFARGSNPYRLGAAEVAMADLLARLQPEGNHLLVQLG